MTAEDDRIIRERDHAAMIDRPDLWPLPGFLPLKKPGKVFDDDGTAFLIQGCGYLVHVGTLGIHNRVTCPKEEYDSAQAIVDAGWVVD